MQRSLLIVAAILAVVAVSAYAAPNPDPFPEPQADSEATKPPSTWTSWAKDKAWSGVTMAAKYSASWLKPLTKRALALTLAAEEEMRRVMTASVSQGFKQMRSDLTGAIFGSSSETSPMTDKDADKMADELEKEITDDMSKNKH